MFCKKDLFLNFSKIVLDNEISVWNPSKIPYERVFKGGHETVDLFEEVPQRTSVTTIYKSFLRPHRDYGVIISDHTTYNLQHATSPFSEIRTIQYNDAVTITRVP